MSLLSGHKQGKLALVVDDSATQRKVLSVLLIEEGYRVITAEDGARGVALYIQQQPDLVLMDISMPVMNGYQAARKIKSLSLKNNLCPLIFITSMDTDESFIESIDAGGDGILVRPFSPEVFKAKIKSIQRISDLYSQVKRLQQQQQKDAELAEQLMFGVIETRNYALDKIGIIKKAAALFSGDIQLTALSPNGDVNVLLGDFTGHGLRSSIGAIPLAETFRAMTKKGFSLAEIITQVNQQLYHLLPADLFLAAGVVTISNHDQSVYVFNAGLPDTYLFDHQGKIKKKISSFHPPLGVLSNLLTDVSVKVLSIEQNDRIVLISDGIIEARNEQGEMFGYQRFEDAAIQGVNGHSVSQTVLRQVELFCQQMPQEDDISLIDLPCGGWQQSFAVNQQNMQPLKVSDTQNNAIPAWHWDLNLTGKRLAKINPVPLAMNYIQELEGHGDHWQSLFTILTELYMNALDHGVLRLSSGLKSSPEGFAQYFSEREKRLKHLTLGFIHIVIQYYPLSNGGKIVVKVKDSGDGFDFPVLNTMPKQGVAHQQQLSGRGIELVQQLCQDLQFSEHGTLAKASFFWQNQQDKN
ncbi:fused response regulator/phosphatase [Thalassotalea insulae]|uniref:Fused response regulator/phosphatase n=1 Tax=Thalassotalea insulae TaxID=2056778 RepID=A0ABQ6GNB6_9GAMM|nr:SpoIIE family protein phosphatase [Thalassotalea insulae]GLX76819.1 fused response regulator/phosphatase [Thalassotalea insulae]